MHAALVVLLVVVAAASSVTRLSAECLPAAPTNPDGSYIVPGAQAGIVYRRVGGRDLKLDAWVPPGARVALPVVVVHGGGFVAGSRIAFVGQLLEMLTDAGHPWFSIDYRLGGLGRREDALEDVREALHFVRCRSAAFGIDPDRLLLLGEDAGAWLALSVAHERAPGVIGAVLVGGTFPSWPEAGEAGTRDAVPLLFVHGTDDGEQPAPDVKGWCTERRRSGARCEMLAVEGASHRAENWWPSQWGYKVTIREWLRALAPGAGAPAAVTLSSRGLPARLAPGLHKRLTYAPEHGLVLDAWVPEPARAGGAPAVIIVHGGGWEAGDRVTYVTPVFEPLAKAGFAWFSIGYRLTPAVRHPVQLEDVRRAVAYVRREAHRFGVDPARIALLGESASGQMVTWIAADTPGLAAVVSFYGVYDLEAMVTDASPRSLLVRLFGPQELDDRARARLREYSPLHQVRSGMAPVLLVHGTAERLWQQGLAMEGALRTAGVRHELLRLDDAPHGMEQWEGRSEWQFYKDRLVSWLREQFGAAMAR